MRLVRSPVLTAPPRCMWAGLCLARSCALVLLLRCPCRDHREGLCKGQSDQRFLSRPAWFGAFDDGHRPVSSVGGRHRLHRRRVAVHPSSSGIERCWAPRHFVELGLRLKRDGYEPFYILAPHERDRWACLAEAGLQIQQAPSLADVAAFIHECGWFIGNESGVGHLASSVGVPTLTLTGGPPEPGHGDRAGPCRISSIPHIFLAADGAIVSGVTGCGRAASWLPLDALPGV